MNKLFAYFLPKKEISYFEELRSKFLITSILIGVLMISIVIGLNVANPTNNFIAMVGSASVVLLFVILNLFILRAFGFKRTGNIFTTGMILILAASMALVLKENVSVVFKYVAGFYSMLAFLVLSVIFSTRKTLILNTVIIIATTTRVYLFGLEHYQSEFELQIIKAGFTQHITVTIIIAVTVYYANLFAEKVLNKSLVETKKVEKQNLQLNGAFELISQTSGTLEKLATNIQESTSALSQNTGTHAASLEEISSTVEELTQSLSSNADYASNTADSVKRTANFSRESKDAVEHTLNSIEKVNSQISVIQDIANKTNLLSINAAIEAARAGEKGKGFSVVANEVKKLAEKSEKGAENIIQLIEGTIEVSNRSWTNYQNIANDIEKIDNAMQEISSAIIEQKTSINHINTGLIQINNSSQQNVDLSEHLDRTLVEIRKNIELLEEQLSNQDVEVINEEV